MKPSYINRMISLLADLKKNHNLRMSESIRKGVALLHIAMKEQAKGMKLAFIDQEGKVSSEVIINSLDHNN